MTKLRRVYQAFVNGITMFLRLAARLLLLLLWFALLLFRWICHGRPQGKPQPCPGEVPGHVRRRPDPCIYSQSYLAKHGLPITWNNPDIFLTDSAGATVDSDNLLPATTYNVNANISNASFDAAIGVSVTCRFRHWGVSVENGIPVEFNDDGTETTRIIDIIPWGATTATFSWTTPNTPAHYCLRVECQHLDDLNTANNAGQENTTVRRIVSGRALTIPLPVSNPERTPSSMHFTLDTYEIEERPWTFDLHTTRRFLGTPRSPRQSKSTGRTQGILSRFENWAFTSGRQLPIYTHYGYSGRQHLFDDQRRRRGQLRPGWKVSIDGRDLESTVHLAAHESREIDVTFVPPADTPLERDRIPINLNAWSDQRGFIGGVTILLDPQRDDQVE